MEKKEVGLLDIPHELLVLHVMEASLGFKDWMSLYASCKTLKNMILTQLPEFKYGQLCMQSFHNNRKVKKDTQHQEEGSEGSDQDVLFGNGLSYDAFFVRDEFVSHSILPRAFKLDRDELPSLLRVKDKEELESAIKRFEDWGSGGGPLLVGNQDLHPWWLPSESEQGPKKDSDDVPRFASWKECYEKHKAASDEMDELLTVLKKSPNCLDAETVHVICERVVRIFKDEPNVLPLKPPLLVYGDIHGHWANLIEIFSKKGWPGEGDLDGLFLGDYVNRGYHSIPTLLLLYAMKIKFPHRVHLLRGMAESHQIATVHGFQPDTNVYGPDNTVFDFICNTFNYMPLAALIGEKIFAVHGGMSPALSKVSDIQLLNRYMDVLEEGLMTDLLWSDPEDLEADWGISPRGAGYIWGPQVSATFLETNNLSFILRSHQLVMEGYGWTHNNKVLTIFTAANYCYRCGNVGCVAVINENCESEFVTYEEVPEVGVPARMTVPYFI